MWAVGCIFAELLTLKPLFQGEVKAPPNPFQLDQLDKIFKVLGHPTPEKWPTLVNLPHWQSDLQHIQGHKYDNPGLYSVVHLPPKHPAYDLLSKMLEYDPRKHITAAQALEHECPLEMLFLGTWAPREFHLDQYLDQCLWLACKGCNHKARHIILLPRSRRY